MQSRSRSIGFIGAGMLVIAGGTALAQQAAAPGALDKRSNNTVLILLETGPHAGTYELPGIGLTCIVEQNKLTATYRDSNARESNKPSGIVVVVDKPDTAGSKDAQITVRFGDAGSAQPPAYDVSVKQDAAAPLKLSMHGRIIDLNYDGRSKGSGRLQLSLRCANVERG